MGDRSLAVIHASAHIPWHHRMVVALQSGLGKLGIANYVTDCRTPSGEGFSILLGTTLWRQIEQAPGDWLLVDRASYGDPDYVSLVWNGHGRRGYHMVPDNWEEKGRDFPPELCVERPQLERTVLCGQCEAYCDRDLMDWYDEESPWATHFRPHPRGEDYEYLPIATGWGGVSKAITLNSSVAIDALLLGIDVEVHDEGGMAYDWERFGSRERFFGWLAWTQWNYEEITNGRPVAHLFDQSG